MSDWELLAEYAAARSQPAFAQLVERHVRWVHSVCTRKLRDPHLAEDVTQAVFLLLSQKAGRIRPGTSITGWLFRTAELTSANAMKARRRRERREAHAAEAAETIASSGRDVSARTESELLTALDRAMASLRQNDRDLLLSRFYGDLTVPQIAEELQISPEAAKKRFTRAMEALRLALTERGATVPATSAAMAIMSAVNATKAHAMPVGLSTWLAGGASPASVSPAAINIARMVTTKTLVVAAAMVAVILLTAGTLVAYAVRHRASATPAVLTAAAQIDAAPTPPSATPPASAPAAPDGIRRLRGHTAWITTAATSPDGRYAASRSLNQLIRWDLSTGQPIGTPTNLADQPFSTAVGANGLVMTLDRRDIVVFDSASAAPRRIGAIDSPTNLSLALAPEAKLAAVGDSVDGSIRLLKVSTGEEVRTLGQHGGMVHCLAFSRDERTLLSGGDDKVVRLWDVSSGKELHRFEGHTSMIHQVCFSPDGTLGASFARSIRNPTTKTKADLFVRVWDLVGKKQRLELPVPTDVVHAVTFSSDGKRVAAVNHLDLIIWDVASGRKLSSRRLREQTRLPTFAVSFSPDGRRLLIGGDGKDLGTLCVFELGDELTRAYPEK